MSAPLSPSLAVGFLVVRVHSASLHQIALNVSFIACQVTSNSDCFSIRGGGGDMASSRFSCRRRNAVATRVLNVVRDSTCSRGMLWYCQGTSPGGKLKR